MIPARFQSTRFPHKVLEKIHGKPLVQWVYEAALNTEFFSDVIIAIDDPQVAEAIDQFGGRYLYTSINCPTGTARVAEVVASMPNPPEIILNWQVDAPLVTKEMLEDLFSDLSSNIEVWTVKKKITSPEDVLNPNVVKVVTDHLDNALYFSRAPIPYARNITQQTTYYKHVGLYAFRLNALSKIKDLPPSPLEDSEVLEQLRFMYHGMKIHVATTEHESVEVDTKEDLVKVSLLLEPSVQMVHSL